MTHIMLDLETLSSAPNAVIVAIGACTFEPDKARRTEERQHFYEVIVPSTSKGEISAKTVQWWAQQPDEVRRVLWQAAASSEFTTLTSFEWFCRDVSAPIVWGNGASFDNVVLRSAYERNSMDAPWTFRNERCYRTLKNLRPDIPFVSKGVKHNALDDAISQAEHAEAIFDALGVAE
jgi:hypothetical protein